jgi:hypothetical protein
MDYLSLAVEHRNVRSRTKWGRWHNMLIAECVAHGHELVQLFEPPEEDTIAHGPLEAIYKAHAILDVRTRDALDRDDIDPPYWVAIFAPDVFRAAVLSSPTTPAVLRAIATCARDLGSESRTTERREYGTRIVLWCASQ